MVSGCKTTQTAVEPENTVVGEVGNENITYGEMRTSFFNAPPAEDDDFDEQLELMNFLDLYLDYRTKVRAAQDAGYFSNREILTELNQYEMQSVYPYWLEMRFKDEMLDELVERSDTEIHTSHILIMVQENASPSDTLAAWNKLMEAREKALSGDYEFADLMEEYSSKQGGRSVGGDLGYLSAGMAVKPFEDVAYSTPQGEVSMPFRSSFGYHILTVHDVREKQPDRSYSHIYFRTRGQGASLELAKERSETAWQKIQDGTPWNEVTTEYTDDPESKDRGGDIGWINPARFQPQFLEGLQSLTTQGEISEPFESEYGIHIVRLDSIRTYRDEAHLREELLERLKGLPRYRENKKYTVEKVRKSGKDSLYTSTHEAFIEVLEQNSELPFSEISFSDEMLRRPFYRIEDRVFPLATYRNFIIKNLDDSSEEVYNHGLLNQYIEERVNDVIIPVTRREFPQFATLSRSYLDGLSVFKITEDSVWTYATTDTLRLREMYENNKDAYRYETRYRYYRITADSDSVLYNAKNVINSGISVDSVRAHVSGLILRTDVINSLADFPFNHLDGLNEGDFSDTFEFRNRPTMLYLQEILPPRQMTFDEAFMRVVSDYQPIREEEWMNSLREDYDVKTYPQRLEKLLN